MYEMDEAIIPNSSAPNPIMHNFNGLELHDFFDGTNNIIPEDRFVNLIRGAETENPFVNFDHCDLINGTNYFVDDHDHNQFGPLTPGDHVFGFNGVSTGSTDDHNPNISLFLNNLDWPSFDGKPRSGDHDLEEEEVEEEEENDREGSSETNRGTSASSAKKSKAKCGDRSKTLISERKRRGRMKEKLYALRSLVPNITKMDKASIVGDAVIYVQELKMQAKKLKDEIRGLETSLLGSQRYQGSSININNSPSQVHVGNANNITNQLIFKNIFQMDMFQVEERGFYMRLVCNKGEGVVASLYKVLESLTSFDVQTSNLASTVDGFELKVTLRVKDTVREMSLPDLKLWVIGALLNQGFEFKSPFSP
ncbi:Basic helix-loop-helix transcription factor [Trema orientale]|uniref:Basic helix-loop-helix transcription factor n=1 Tax=Trema orientale TaxID=63057 RepID=A0A2P5FTM6_TREOI|nr:Basic helix-loop-helix transcription factor [Trema orientale]